MEAITEPVEPLLNEAGTHLPVQTLSFATLMIMSIACAAAAANIYYNQPLLSEFATYFHATTAHAGLVATAAQVGYGVGLFFLVPLGDIVERRTVVVSLAYACVGCLALAACSPTLTVLIVAQALVGIAAVSTQLLIPLAVDLSPESQRGQTIGFLMTGVLCGLLLARTLGGFVGDHLGWRGMFWIAAATMLLVGIVLQFTLPRRPPQLRLPYLHLLHSLWELFKTQSVVRNTSLVSASSFASFCAFWAVLSFLLHDQFRMGATPAGLFGFVGLAGAVCAPLAGKLSDRKGAAFALTLSMILCILSFASMLLWHSIAGLVVGVLLLDLGAQSTQVSSQTEIMAAMPTARNRLNTIFMVSRYAGGAAGSFLGTIAYAEYGWRGTCWFCMFVLIAGTGLHFLSAPARNAATPTGLAAR